MVSAADGVQERTKVAVELAKGSIQHFVIFLNKCDVVDDLEILDIVEIETRELLNEHGFSGDDVPVIRSSALKALRGDRAAQKDVETLFLELDKAAST